jgi:hypothetical protein
MSKIILEFDSIESAGEALDAINGWKWRLVVYDLDQKLRETTKYGNPIISEGPEANTIEMAVVDRLRDIIREIVQDYKLNLED